MKIIKNLPGLPIERTLAVLSGRWKAVILYVLLDGPHRTYELDNRIAGISQKVLIEQLRALEQHGLVSRQASAQDSQGVEYLLTSLGESLRPVLDSLLEWGTHHARELNETHRLLPCEAVVQERTARTARTANRPLESAGANEARGAAEPGTAQDRHRSVA